MNPDEVPHNLPEQETCPAAVPALDSSPDISQINILSRENARTLHRLASNHAQALLRPYNPEFTANAEVKARLDEWCASAAGQVILGSVVDNLLETLAHKANPGPPSHDFRHMAIKDPISALKICCETSLSPYEETFLISTLAHDIGRLAEHHLMEESLGEVPGHVHGEFSFIYLKSILDEYPSIPPELANDLLHAVLKHSTLTPVQNRILEAVQQADRAHMLGPEGVARFLAYDVGMCDLKLVDKNLLGKSILFSSEPHDSFVSTTAYFIQHMAPPTMGDSLSHFNELRASSAIFLMLLHPPEGRDQIPNHHLFTTLGRSDLPPLDWQTVRERADRFPASNRDLRELLTEVMSPPFSPDAEETMRYGPQGCLSDTSTFETVLAELESLPENIKQRFATALAFQLEERTHFDRLDEEVLQRTRQQFARSGSLSERVARFVQSALAGRYA